MLRVSSQLTLRSAILFLALLLLSFLLSPACGKYFLELKLAHDRVDLLHRVHADLRANETTVKNKGLGHKTTTSTKFINN